MKLTSLAKVTTAAVATAAFSLGAVADGDKHQQSQGPEAVTPAQGESAASGGSAPTTPSTEGNTPSGAVISSERTAEPKAESPTAAGSSVTEQKPEQVPPPATTKQQ
jgi:hypothetical protein